MDLALAALLGVLSSLVAAALFLFALATLRPCIEISPYIAKSRDPEGKTTYWIKIVNRSRRSAVNLRVELRIRIPVNVPGGVVFHTNKIELYKSEVFELAGYRRRDQDANYACRFRSYQDLEVMWNDDARSYLIFQVFAADSLTGFGRVASRRFHTKRNSLKEGDFEFGDSFDVK